MKERRLTGIDSLNEIWNEIFLNAIYNGNLYIKGKDLHMEVNNVDNIINVNHFKLAFQDTFHKVYRETLYPLFEPNSLSSEQVDSVCVWLNPILKELKIDGYEEYKEKFTDKYSKDGKNYNSAAANNFRFQLRNTLMDIDPKRRKKLITNILPYKILNFSDLVALRYYTDIPKSSELDEYRDENGNFSEDTKQALAELSMERLLKLKSLKGKVTGNRIKRYSQYIPSDFFINMVEWGQIPYSYLEHSNVTKKDIFSLKYEVLISVLEHQDDYPENLKITSQDILDEYGKTINGSRLYKLIMYRYVDSKQVIDVIRKNKVLRLSGEPEENLFGDEEVFSYYSSTKLSEMFLTGNIDSDFIEKYKKELNDEELFQKKSEAAIEQIKFNIMTNIEIPVEEKNEILQKNIVEAYKVGLCTPEVLKENISPEYIEEQYLNGNISDVNILNLYKAGVVGPDIIKTYFSEKEIFDLYLKGEIDRDIISTLENTEERDEEILDSVMEGKMPLIDVVNLYLNGTLTIEMLEDAVEFSPEEIDFSTCIDENTNFSKIKEMFERKIIDYNCVTNLKDTGIITEEQLEELKQTMDKAKFFDDLQGKTFKLVTDRKSKEKLTRSKSSDAESKPQKDNSERYIKEKELISKILGIEDIHGSIEEYATIESYNQKGRPTSLNGYRIFGSRENGLVIFARFQKENAVFIMPFYQAAYFLNSRGQENARDVVIEDRMKDKAYLRTLNQVEVIPHTEYFARNLSLAACRLSPEFEEKYKGDTKYRSEVQRLCQDMRTDYRIEKGLEEL